MTTDKTGAEATVRAGDGEYTIAVDGENVGLAAVADRGEQRVFYHTEVDERFGGRGLASILVQQALEATRADGKRVVATCPMVAAFIKKHPEFAHITDPVTPAILQWVETL
jgi:predicted GNAT family acetyltransferase